MSESRKKRRNRAIGPAFAGVVAGMFAVGSTLSGCTSVPITGRKSLELVSEAEVTKMSMAAFEDLKRMQKPSLDREQNEMLQRVGGRLAEVVFWDIPNARWEFVVFSSPAQVNAFAMAGGKVGVYSGIFDVAKTDDELAVVVAHEISHVVAKHVNERLSEEMLMKVGGGLLAATTGGGSLTVQGVMLAYGFGSGVVGLGFDRNKEREADRMGLIYMAKAGFDPRAAIALWQRMDELESGGASPPPSWLSTHPSNLDRMIRLREAMPPAVEIYEEVKASEIRE